ncbi:hypothetical protein [Catenuloplanes atrovinosus]|uniref:Uncharacterized protein n=1 Tax=Catenuloplanes atrovinosus TaxID=137266 RepID=A0AAE4CET3_9ACTN|nr:hypothetical protein [Catenuloplanes atrovinosus]MDR7278940.1 hypothetical protein [Catenuloplanes atrovinosus]
MTIYETDTDLYRRWDGAATWDFVAVGRPTLAAGQITANSPTSNSTTPVGVYRFDDIPVRAGRLIHIVMTGVRFGASGDNNDAQLRWHYTEDGSTPTGASPVADGLTHRIVSSAAIASPKISWTARYRAPATAVTLSLLLSVARAGGSNTVLISPDTLPVEILIEDKGPAPSFTGTTL